MKSYEQKIWELDIATFERYKVILDTIKTPNIRQMLIKRLNEIKNKYRSLKNEAIPAE
jgi:hypothetical protein